MPDIQIADPQMFSLAEIVDAVSRHGVIVFRNQSADDAAFVGFLKSLGPMMFTDGETPVQGAPELNIVSNIGRSRPPRSVFHTDTSYVAKPPAFSALRAVMLPSEGGETLFSDQVRAACGLPSGLWEQLRHRTLVHRAQAPGGGTLEARHPLLRRHPVTGETALFLSTPERCSELSGFSDAASARIIMGLYMRSTRDADLYRHRWQRGDIVLWDNRITMHRADHRAVIGDRVLHRGMVQGELPIAA